MSPDDFFKRELRYRLRMLDEPWRRVGLHIASVCRCEQATPCFDHICYIADLREEDTEAKHAEATALYLRLTK